MDVEAETPVTMVLDILSKLHVFDVVCSYPMSLRSGHGSSNVSTKGIGGIEMTITTLTSREFNALFADEKF